MDNVSIILLIRQCTGNNIVEVTGECEKEYNELALYAFATRVINSAKTCGGKMTLWTGEPQYQKFCYAFRFETEQEKEEFLVKISKKNL